MFPEIDDRINCNLKEGDKVRVALFKDIFKKDIHKIGHQRSTPLKKFFKKRVFVGTKLKTSLAQYIPKQNISTI